MKVVLNQKTYKFVPKELRKFELDYISILLSYIIRWHNTYYIQVQCKCIVQPLMLSTCSSNASSPSLIDWSNSNCDHFHSFSENWSRKCLYEYRLKNWCFTLQLCTDAICFESELKCRLSMLLEGFSIILLILRLPKPNIITFLST